MSVKDQIPKFGVLNGVKVVAAVSSVAGPYVTCMFAENGADVVSIENNLSPDPLRTYPYWYAQEHRNQRQLALNSKDEAGRQVLKKLLESADVFIESSKARTYDKWGLSDESMWEFNPKLVIVHISGFGQTGVEEYYKKASYDYIGQAFSGIVLQNGEPDPSLPGYLKPNGCDFFTGLQAAWSAMAALFNAQRTGKGESVDVSQYESLYRVQAHYPIYGFMHGAEAVRYKGLDPNMAGDAFYKSKDGKFLTICIQGRGPIEKSLPLLGITGADAEEFKGHTMIMKYQPFAEKHIQAIRDFCATRTAVEVEKAMGDVGLPCSQTLTYSDMLENPQYKAREDIIEYFSPYANETIKGPAAFPKFKNNPQVIWRGGGIFGQDNEEILEEIGYTEGQIRELYAKKIIARGECVEETESEKIAQGKPCGISYDNLPKHMKM